MRKSVFSSIVAEGCQLRDGVTAWLGFSNISHDALCGVIVLHGPGNRYSSNELEIAATDNEPEDSAERDELEIAATDNEPEDSAERDELNIGTTIFDMQEIMVSGLPHHGIPPYEQWRVEAVKRGSDSRPSYFTELLEHMSLRGALELRCLFCGDAVDFRVPLSERLELHGKFRVLLPEEVELRNQDSAEEKLLAEKFFHFSSEPMLMAK